MPNMGRKAMTNSMGVLKRIEAPQSERNMQVKMITEGMEMIIVVVWKKVATLVPMPVRYIWWAQTMKERKPIVRAA